MWTQIAQLEMAYWKLIAQLDEELELQIQKLNVNYFMLR